MVQITSSVNGWWKKENLNSSKNRSLNHYCTFSIPLKSHDGLIELDDDRVHGWMFGPKTVLMVPNKMGYATGGCIYPAGEDPIAGWRDTKAVKEYSEKLSPESLAKFVDEEEAKVLLIRPINYVKTAKCNTLHVRDYVVLFIGDSAHAVSVSMGQACNCALQDVENFMEYLDEKKDVSVTRPFSTSAGYEMPRSCKNCLTLPCQAKKVATD